MIVGSGALLARYCIGRKCRTSNQNAGVSEILYQRLSTSFLKFCRIESQPCLCASPEWASSASKLSTMRVAPDSGTKSIDTFRSSPREYSILRFGVTAVNSPSKSKPIEPSLASIRYLNFPPGRRSSSALGHAQSSEAKFHWVICAGDVQAFHAASTGAFTVTSMVIFMLEKESLPNVKDEPRARLARSVRQHRS